MMTQPDIRKPAQQVLVWHTGDNHQDNIRRSIFLNASFTLAGRLFATGTVFFRRADNDAEVKAKPGALAAKHGAEIVPLDSAFVERCRSLGSNQAALAQLPQKAFLLPQPLGQRSLPLPKTRITGPMLKARSFCFSMLCCWEPLTDVRGDVDHDSLFPHYETSPRLLHHINTCQ